MKNSKLNVAILAAAQALEMTGPPVIILLGGIIGSELAPTPALATLPISLVILGVAVFAIPAAMIMRRVGRRAGFAGGALLASGGALLAALAVARGSFLLFCLAVLLIGANGAFMQQFRFAAVESVAPIWAGRAVSIVLVGGVAAGFLGPEIARRAKDLLEWGQYTGSFTSLAVIYLAAAGLLLFLKDTRLEKNLEGQESSLREVFHRPVFQTAILAGAVAYGAMSLIMTATPVHLYQGSGYSLDETALVIQSHMIAMYLPSFFSGFLIERLGVLRIMVVGLVSIAACVFFSIAGQSLVYYWVALVLLGLGWNFLFVGATVLLTHSYEPGERFKAQAANDFTIFGVQSFASLSAGTLLYYTSWPVLNLATLPFLLAVMAAMLSARRGIWGAIKAS
jgi:MFS family permease